MESKNLEVYMLKSSLPAVLGDFVGGIFGGKLIRDQELCTLSLLLPC